MNIIFNESKVKYARLVTGNNQMTHEKRTTENITSVCKTLRLERL